MDNIGRQHIGITVLGTLIRPTMRMRISVVDESPATASPGDLISKDGILHIWNGAKWLPCHESESDAAKWQRYEQEYILPCFGLAASVGIDLREELRRNPGTDCVILLVKLLISRISQKETGKIPVDPGRSRIESDDESRGIFKLDDPRLGESV